jgi:hypothetical protein
MTLGRYRRAFNFPEEIPMKNADEKRPDLITLDEAARALRLRYHVVRRLAVKGALRSVTIGGRRFVERADLARVRREQPWAPWAMRVYKSSAGGDRPSA